MIRVLGDRPRPAQNAGAIRSIPLGQSRARTNPRPEFQVVTQRLDKNETVQRQQGLFELGEIWSNYLDPLAGASRDEG